jgi:hypothetical protein
MISQSVSLLVSAVVSHSDNQSDENVRFFSFPTAYASRLKAPTGMNMS